MALRRGCRGRVLSSGIELEFDGCESDVPVISLFDEVNVVVERYLPVPRFCFFFLFCPVKSPQIPSTNSLQ